MNTKFIAVANEKGGVAKTTTTVSLGGALVEAGKEVLVVDLDPQANMTLGLGIQPTSVRRSIADVLMNSESPLSVSRETAIPGLDIIPSNSEMGLAERFMPIRTNYEVLLRDAFKLDLSYDYVLFDCPPSIGAITTNALTACNLLIIPTQPEYFSAYALRSMMSTVRTIREKTNPSLLYRVLITMLDRRNRTHRTLTDQLRATFADGHFDIAIQTDTKLRESPIVGLPITHYTPNSRSAQQYRMLAQELIEHVQIVQKESVRQSA